MTKIQPNSKQFSDLFSEFADTAKKAGEKIVRAINEDADEPILKSVSKDCLNFESLEEDIKEIHKKLQKDGSSILGTYLNIEIVDRDSKKSKYAIEIKTYLQKKDETFSNISQIEVSKINNLPEDLQSEIEKAGKVKLKIEN